QPEEQPLYDQPEEDKKRIRVSGPFTVETLQSLDVSSPESLNDKQNDYDEYAAFTERIFNNLKANGIRNGDKTQQAIMHAMEHLDEPYLNAKGYYKKDDGTEQCVYFMIGPKFGTVSKYAVNEAIRAFRQHLNESNWLVILGFSFEDTIESGAVKDYNFGSFQVWKARMSDDLLQDGLLKKDKKAGSFIIIGEPDVSLVNDGDGTCHVEINGMDMYDPIQDEVKARNINDSPIGKWTTTTQAASSRCAASTSAEATRKSSLIGAKASTPLPKTSPKRRQSAHFAWSSTKRYGTRSMTSRANQSPTRKAERWLSASSHSSERKARKSLKCEIVKLSNREVLDCSLQRKHLPHRCCSRSK
ncbi:MAG: hypothetical protein IKP36_04460, partial [Bacteroidaceae bacterium]|nr:hypothetical protein [Bacteroidaceae bacterium]